MRKFDIAVIGGGPAGLAAAEKADEQGRSVLLIEREAKLGGILKQCIHDGFGLIRFGEKLSGPEYYTRFSEKVKKSKVTLQMFSFVTKLEKKDDGFVITFVSQKGMETVFAYKLILSTGCRERTKNQIFIQGDRGSGVMTAGCAQRLVNIEGVLPTKRCVILGSGDIGLIMARRLTLEGAEVVGVYEAKSTPSGLQRNIHQCLIDFSIPLYLSKTVTRVIGKERLEAVEICSVDENMRPDLTTAKIVECDCLILAVGLIPENEIAEKIDVPLCKSTKGAIVDQNLQTMVDGVYSCGNALHVFDLVDYVSESGALAGETKGGANRRFVDVVCSNRIAYVVPQRLDITSDVKNVIMFFRSKEITDKQRLTVTVNGERVFTKKYQRILPPEMERIVVDFPETIKDGSLVEVALEDF